MRSMNIRTVCQNFTSEGNQLVSWKTSGWSSDEEDRSRDWQFESCVIATIPEADDFLKKLAAAIDGAKARLALANAAVEKSIEERAKDCGALAMKANGDFEVTTP